MVVRIDGAVFAVLTQPDKKLAVRLNESVPRSWNSRCGFQFLQRIKRAVGIEIYFIVQDPAGVRGTVRYRLDLIFRIRKSPLHFFVPD